MIPLPEEEEYPSRVVANNQPAVGRLNTTLEDVVRYHNNSPALPLRFPLRLSPAP